MLCGPAHFVRTAQAEERIFDKLANKNFLADVRPLLSADEASSFDEEAARAAFRLVFSAFIKRIPGHAWGKTAATAERLGMTDLVDG
jgi:hypothetical protein